MADTPKDSSPSSKENNNATGAGANPPGGKSTKTRTLVLSIASSALLVSFAAYTLMKTDFKTYPKDEAVDIAELTKQPEAFVYIDDSSDSDEPLSFEDLLSDNQTSDVIFVSDHNEAHKDTPAPAATVDPQIQQQLAARQAELEELQDRYAVLEHKLAQKQLEATSLQEILDDKTRQLKVLSELPPPAAHEEDATAPEDLARENEELRRLNVRIESQLADARNRLKQHQDALAVNDDKVRDLDARLRELARRQEALQKERDILAKDKTILDSKLAQSQQRLAAQERSFQELSNALKGHKEAMKRMDQSRMEMASELDATKSQYSKLLHAVAAKAKEAPGSASTKSDIDNLTAMAPEVPSAHRAPIASEDGETRYHVVGKGDTLTSISRQYYGTSQRWPEVYDANQAVITDHNRLKVGLVLVIP